LHEHEETLSTTSHDRGRHYRRVPNTLSSSRIQLSGFLVDIFGRAQKQSIPGVRHQTVPALKSPPHLASVVPYSTCAITAAVSVGNCPLKRVLSSSVAAVVVPSCATGFRLVKRRNRGRARAEILRACATHSEEKKPLRSLAPALNELAVFCWLSC